MSWACILFLKNSENNSIHERLFWMCQWTSIVFQSVLHWQTTVSSKMHIW
jgi:hypothetical protein